MLLLQDIAVTYNNIIAAVQGVSIEVPDKTVVALLGANGAGKTTTLRAISGLLRMHRASITRGSILFDGQRIDHLNTTQIVQRGISQVLEGRRLFADLTVDENLRTGAISTRDSTAVRKAYDRVMDLFPVLRGRGKGQAGYLSGGEQQMLAIGRGLSRLPITATCWKLERSPWRSQLPNSCRTRACASFILACTRVKNEAV